VIIKSKIAITATTKKIPTPTPALKIPLTMEQLDKVSKRKANNEILVSIFCMI
jgi:hypothetical protein